MRKRRFTTPIKYVLVLEMHAKVKNDAHEMNPKAKSVSNYRAFWNLEKLLGALRDGDEILMDDKNEPLTVHFREPADEDGPAVSGDVQVKFEPVGDAPLEAPYGDTRFYVSETTLSPPVVHQYLDVVLEKFHELLSYDKNEPLPHPVWQYVESIGVSKLLSEPVYDSNVRVTIPGLQIFLAGK